MRTDFHEDLPVTVEIAEAFAAFERKAAMAGEPAAGLEDDFGEDSEGHMAIGIVAEIPSVWRDVVFGDDAGAGFLHAGTGGNLRDASHHVIGRLGQARGAAGSVEGDVQVSEGR